MRKLLLLLLITSTFNSFSQEKHSTDFIERRVDFLICTKKYANLIETMQKESLVITGTDVKNGIAKCHYGKPTENKKVPSIFYTIAYDIKKDKILSVSKNNK